MIRHWTGRHLAHPIWHWVWFTATNQHGYGPTYDIALAAAKACRPTKERVINMTRRI